MTKNFLCAAIFMVAFALSCGAQVETDPSKKFSHYVGLQINQLIKEIINLSTSNTDIDNPYLLIYSIKDNKTGWGGNAGFGFDYQKINDVTPESRETKTKNLFYRVGVGRKVMVGKRFEAGYGMDFVGDYQLSKTFTSSVTVFGSSIDSSESHVTNRTTSIGFGPQLNLSFYFTERLMLGTETTFYYVTSAQKQNVITTDNVFTQFPTPVTTTTTSNSNAETDVSTFSFSLPLALFLILKF